MEKPPLRTLEDVRRALEDQDRQLQVARNEVVFEPGNRPILVASAALERLREECAERPRRNRNSKSTTGIRC